MGQPRRCGPRPICNRVPGSITAGAAISSIQLALTVIGQRSFATSIGLRFFLRESSKAGAVHRKSARLDHVTVRDDVYGSGPSRSERPLEGRRDIRRVLDKLALGAETLGGAFVMRSEERRVG